MTEPSEHILRVGLTFNLKRDGGDEEAEFESPETIQALASAITGLGHEVLLLEADQDLPRKLMDARPDVVFNMAEGFFGRSREAQVPAMLEFLGIPYTASDPTTLSICLDKNLTKVVLGAAGILTPAGQLLETGDEPLQALRFPAIVKPNTEGSSKGITDASVVFDEASARAEARRLIRRYGGGALAEEYIQGREITVGLLGEREPRVFPPLECVFLDRREFPVYGYEEKQDRKPKIRFDCPAQLTPIETARIQKTARDAFVALGCRDVARIDMRLSSDGSVYVIECNPLPGLIPSFSDICVITEASGLDFQTLVGEILAGGIRRAKRLCAAAHGNTRKTECVLPLFRQEKPSAYLGGSHERAE